MEEKMAAVLGNPQLMQQIMSMAQTLGGNADTQSPPPDIPPADMSPELLRSIMGIVGKIGTDSHQQALLHALRPYLTDSRIGKLERAMRAAKLASLASTALNSGALSFLTGR